MASQSVQPVPTWVNMAWSVAWLARWWRARWWHARWWHGGGPLCTVVAHSLCEVVQYPTNGAAQVCFLLCLGCFHLVIVKIRKSDGRQSDTYREETFSILKNVDATVTKV